MTGEKRAGAERKVILRTEGLTKHYGGVRALEDANFELLDGEHVAIVGDNGAGPRAAADGGCCEDDDRFT